jgi:uncharacterized membrane protein YagU involved in acid resistance
MWKRRNPVKGALAGMAGGLIASYVMTEFQVALKKLKNGRETSKPHNPADEPATIKAAEMVSEPLLGRDLRPEEKGPSGKIVHYAFGTAVGGVYGLLAEQRPEARLCLGTAFGSVLWFLSDEIAVPALGLSKGPLDDGLSVHASALASHLVYGATTECVRSGLRQLLSVPPWMFRLGWRALRARG